MKGLDDRYLETLEGGKTLEMGHNNRAFLFDYEYDDSSYWTYKHYSFLGGSLEYDIDLSQMPCQCAAGAFLAYVDDDQCSWDPLARGTKPECDTMSLMEANDGGFIQRHSECSSGTCTEPRQC